MDNFSNLLHSFYWHCLPNLVLTYWAGNSAFYNNASKEHFDLGCMQYIKAVGGLFKDMKDDRTQT